ncbi:MAG TPA: HlyD family efflux transporter periplasmic adaptor subunit, partial [Anaerolineales bacterium]|nr:HlyD family efflux transporter periplasmic adaptor subunit [Anaerolineales bacterium]
MKKFTLVLALLLVLSTVGCGPAASTAIQASGQIEATEISVAPELSGLVVAVSVDEGDPVKAGDPLIRLDDSLLQSQKKSAQAALDSANASAQAAGDALAAAQAEYDLTLSNALAADQPARLDLWQGPKPDQFDQPVWYFSKEEQIKAAQAEADAAKASLADAQAKLANVEKEASSADFLNIEAQLAEARLKFQVARNVLNSTSSASNSQALHDPAQTIYDDARTGLQNAQQAYDRALTTQAARDVLAARADVTVWQENYDATLDAWRALQTGADSPQVAAEGKLVDQAKSTLLQAQAAVLAAQANLDAINTQLAKLTITSPIDGVVLTRSIQPGEVLQAGTAALTIGQLNALKVTVYIPETQYGQINLGQAASLSVDSFPDQSFPARVTRIADQAEYTPQNVQTKEGRQTTVYAVE